MSNRRKQAETPTQYYYRMKTEIKPMIINLYHLEEVFVDNMLLYHFSDQAKDIWTKQLKEEIIIIKNKLVSMINILKLLIEERQAKYSDDKINKKPTKIKIKNLKLTDNEEEKEIVSDNSEDDLKTDN